MFARVQVRVGTTTVPVADIVVDAPNRRVAARKATAFVKSEFGLPPSQALLATIPGEYVVPACFRRIRIDDHFDAALLPSGDELYVLR